jgi:hypothetical protein
VREKKHSWFDDQCTIVTDSEGNSDPPRVRWLAHVRKDTKNGGPVAWIHETYHCTAACLDPNHWRYGLCCNDFNVCKSDAPSFQEDPDVRYTMFRHYDFKL